jgi:hypothetical protein
VGEDILLSERHGRVLVRVYLLSERVRGVIKGSGRASCT